jgi:L-lactate utilization protein LutC
MVYRNELSIAIAEILRSHQLKRVVGYDSLYMQSIKFREAISKRVDAEIQWFPATKPANFDEKDYRTALTNADAAITSAEYLIAQTGTVIFTGKHHPSKLISPAKIKAPQRFFSPAPAAPQILKKSWCWGFTARKSCLLLL